MDSPVDGPFSNIIPVCLASSSPRRKLFLHNLGLNFTVKSPPVDEPLPEAGENPESFSSRSARAKAYAVARATEKLSPPSRPAIIAADTVVTIDGKILGKPENPAHGLEMLRLLNGREHTVISSCCFLMPDGRSWRERNALESTLVRFWHVPEKALAAYAYSDEPTDKAGGYAITGAGAFMVESVYGSVNNVVGLPLTSLIRVLLEEKVLV